jgi:hypothetical protein
VRERVEYEPVGGLGQSSQWGPGAKLLHGQGASPLAAEQLLGITD